MPDAAEVRDDGSLVYRLDADPQGMVTTPKLGALRVPPGLPGHRGTLAVEDASRGGRVDPLPLTQSSTWEIVAAKAAG